MVDTNAATSEWIAALLALLERQDASVAALTALSGRQSALIESSRTDALLGLLAERQRIIDDFAGMQGELIVLTDGMEQKLASLDPAQRDHIRVLINRIGDNLGAVMRRDEEDQRSLEVARRRTKAEIDTVGTQQQARHAYVGSSSSAPRFADRKG